MGNNRSSGPTGDTPNSKRVKVVCHGELPIFDPNRLSEEDKNRLSEELEDANRLSDEWGAKPKLEPEERQWLTEVMAGRTSGGAAGEHNLEDSISDEFLSEMMTNPDLMDELLDGDLLRLSGPAGEQLRL